MSQPTDARPDRVSGHVAAFNDAVADGDYERLAERFAEDAVMSFVGVPVGPFVGRDAILVAYQEMPPDDTMAITSVHTDGEIDNVRFLWSAGGAGTMTMRWENDLLAELTVVFDQG
jgi:ketosteroid isomerase-like protein